MSQLQVIKERFQTLLGQAMKDRDKREQFVPRDGGAGTEPGWAAHERAVMHEAINQERAKLSKKPLALAEVERVEQLALGHSDYTPKFALYCAELVLQER